MLDPPPGYLSPPVDILGGLATIRNMSAANVYKSQYDFDIELFQLISSANDGHFAVFPCSMQLFLWQTDTALVSVSSDGVQIPKIYTFGGFILVQSTHESAD